MLGKKGMSAIDLVYVAVILIIGVGIFSQIDSSISTTGWSTAALAAKGNTTANTFGGFQTASVAPTVIGAVIVLGVVGLLVARR